MSNKTLPRLESLAPPRRAIGAAVSAAAPVIQVEQLSKSFGSNLAVDGLSFDVCSGAVVGFLGPNGAGKTTTLRILSGFLAPSSGRVRVGGDDVQRHRLKVQAGLGYMPEATPTHPELRVVEYLRFRAQLKRVAARGRHTEIERVMDLAGLTARQNALAAHLSKGYRQRLGLADALLGNPNLLILDEPTAGLDPNQIREVRQLIRDLGEQHTVLLSTHILSEVEMVCSRALVIDRGRLVAEGSLDDLRGLRTPQVGKLIVLGEVAKAPRGVTDHAEIIASKQSGNKTQWDLKLNKPDQGMSPLVEAATSSGLRVFEARLGEPKLEDVFAELTRSHVAGAP